MHIGEPFRTVGGILAGAPTFVQVPEVSRLRELYQQE
jgi:hypothetical protein